MLEPFLINPPKRRFRSNPLGVDELVILNPPARRAKKRRKTVAIRRKRNAKGRFVKGGVKTKRRRRSSRKTTSRIRRAVRRSGVRRKVRTLRRRTVYITNPRRRRSHARRVHHRQYRRNPGLGFSMGSIVPTLKEGAFIALGAVAVGQAMARLPYVSTLTGPTRHLARIGVAILGGKLISKFLRQPALGRAFAMGGVVATALQLAQENFPTIVALNSMEEMGLGLYYATPGAVGDYYSAGPTVSLQPDGMGFESDMPERLSQNRF